MTGRGGREREQLKKDSEKENISENSDKKENISENSDKEKYK